MTTDVLDVNKNPPDGVINTCSVEGCEKPARARGWCKTHYKRWYKHGDVMTLKREGPYKGKRCSVEGCDEQPFARKLCRKHYKAQPHMRASEFLINAPDCTSPRKEITAIYDAVVNELTGEVGEIGPGWMGNLVLDHIHDGPAVGLIPSWLNVMLNDEIMEHWEAVQRYVDKRRSMVCES